MQLIFSEGEVGKASCLATNGTQIRHSCVLDEVSPDNGEPPGFWQRSAQKREKCMSKTHHVDLFVLTF